MMFRGEFLGPDAEAAQLRLLRAGAQLDDSEEATWDWTLTFLEASETNLTAPRLLISQNRKLRFGAQTPINPAFLHGF